MAEELTTAQKNLYAEVESITQDNSAQLKINQEAMMNREFIKGRQWIYLDHNGEIQQRRRDERYYHLHRKYRPRETVNIIFPIYRTYKSYLLKTRPQIMATPESMDEVYDILASRTATKLLEYIYESLFIRKKHEEVADNMLVYGTAIIHPFVREIGPKTFVVDAEVIPPSQFFPYPIGETDPDRMEGFVWQRIRFTKVLQQMYPNQADDIVASPPEGNLMNLGYDYDSPTKDPISVVSDFYKLPKGEEKGCFIRFAGKAVLQHIEKYPYKYNKDRNGKWRLPAIMVHDNHLPDELFGFSTITLLRSRQISYNEGKSRLAQLRQQIPKFLVDVNSKQRLEDITDPDQSIHEYVGGSGDKPGYTGPPIMSPALINDVTNMPREIEHLSGFHETLLRGESIGSIQSGRGIMALQQKDELRLTPALESVRLGYIQTFEQFYAFVRQYYKQSQIKEILGEMGELEIISFETVKLSPMTFNIEETTFSPYSQEFRSQLMTNILPLGVINVNDPNQRRKSLHWIHPTLAATFETTTAEERRARVENAKMLKGEETIVFPDDDDVTHIDAHNIVIKDPRFRELDRDVIELFLKHMAKHKAQGEKKMAETMQAMQQMQGMGGGPPGQPQPPGAQPPPVGLGQ